MKKFAMRLPKTVTARAEVLAQQQLACQPFLLAYSAPCSRRILRLALAYGLTALSPADVPLPVFTRRRRHASAEDVYAIEDPYTLPLSSALFDQLHAFFTACSASAGGRSHVVRFLILYGLDRLENTPVPSWFSFQRVALTER